MLASLVSYMVAGLCHSHVSWFLVSSTDSHRRSTSFPRRSCVGKHIVLLVSSADLRMFVLVCCADPRHGLCPSFLGRSAGPGPHSCTVTFLFIILIRLLSVSCGAAHRPLTDWSTSQSLLPACGRAQHSALCHDTSLVQH